MSLPPGIALACIAPQKPAPLTPAMLKKTRFPPQKPPPPLTPAMLKKTRFPPQKPFLSIQHSPDVVAWKAAHWLHHRARALWERGGDALGGVRGAGGAWGAH